MKKKLIYVTIAIMAWLILYCTIDIYNVSTFEGLDEGNAPPNDNTPGGQSDTKNINSNINPPLALPPDNNEMSEMNSFPNLPHENIISNNPIKRNKQYMSDSVHLEDSLPRINSNEIAILKRRMDRMKSKQDANR